MDIRTIIITILLIEGISVCLSAVSSRWFYQFTLNRQRNKVQQSLSQPLEKVVLSQSKHDGAYRSSVLVFFFLSWFFTTLLFSIVLTLSFSSFVSFLTHYENDAYLWLYISCLFALFLGTVLIFNLTGYFAAMRSANKRVMKELEDLSHSYWY